MTPFSPSTPVTALFGVGAAVEKKLHRLGITTLGELLWHLPQRYDDFRTRVAIADANIGQRVTIEGTIDLIASRRSRRRRMILTEALVSDTTGTIKVLWFNQPFLAKNFKAHEKIRLSGTVSDHFGQCQLVSPVYEKPDGDGLHTGRLVPIYPATSGLTQRQLRMWVRGALQVSAQIPDPLPAQLRAKEHLLPLGDALATLHFPENEAQRDAALRRLAFDELLQFHLRQLRARPHPGTAPSLHLSAATRDAFIRHLPYTLTDGQQTAVQEILADLRADVPMERLLSGDVGSGKTVVAAFAALAALDRLHSAAYMAPTELLAGQQFAVLRKLFAPFPVRVVLVTGATRHERHSTSAAEPTLFVGTHALLHKKPPLPHLGVIIIDEQHRFGVAQREALQHTGASEKRPHMLSLTATPIPRSLALTLAGEVRISTLTTQPAGRKPVATRVTQPHQRALMYDFVERHLRAGRQAYALAPLVEPSDVLGAASAVTLHEELQQRFSKFRIGLLHGKLPPGEKHETLAAFARHEIDLLVATPVIEVGIDVPGATVIVIEGAERFGLAQLHQLRGRVGRSDKQSFCFLLPQTLTPLVRRRLDAVAATNDGFRLAELDLELRGPGDLWGLEQSGFLDFRFASLGDTMLFEHTKRVAHILDTKKNK